jgi:hypothetical protein
MASCIGRPRRWPDHPGQQEAQSGTLQRRRAAARLDKIAGDGQARQRTEFALGRQLRPGGKPGFAAAARSAGRRTYPY